jgi:hypothetical protein
MEKTEKERNIEILEFNISECDRLISVYEKNNISEKKISIQQDKKNKHIVNLNYIKSQN